MTFVAKYSGSCRECGQTIEVGDHATYMDNKVVHLRCADPGSESTWVEAAFAHQAKRSRVCSRCHYASGNIVNGLCPDCS